jgi:hypothetical protein
LKYHKPPQPRWNLECMMESDSGTVLDPPCPITVIAQFDLQGTWSAQIGQYQLPSLCRVPLTFDRKSMPIVAWYMLSKESYIKRVIRDVFPTAYPYQHLQTGFALTSCIPLCSPRKTNLYNHQYTLPRIRGRGQC